MKPLFFDETYSGESKRGEASLIFLPSPRYIGERGIRGVRLIPISAIMILSIRDLGGKAING